MGKKMTRAGIELRRAIRADLDASPGIDHLAIRRKFVVGEPILESALTKTLAEWDALLANTPADSQGTLPGTKTSTKNEKDVSRAGLAMPGLEQGVVKFKRKPAKMGMDFIFWVPRVYIKNGLVEPGFEYEVYLRKVPKV